MPPVFQDNPRRYTNGAPAKGRIGVGRFWNNSWQCIQGIQVLTAMLRDLNTCLKRNRTDQEKTFFQPALADAADFLALMCYVHIWVFEAFSEEAKWYLDNDQATFAQGRDIITAVKQNLAGQVLPAGDAEAKKATDSIGELLIKTVKDLNTNTKGQGWNTVDGNAVAEMKRLLGLFSKNITAAKTDQKRKEALALLRTGVGQFLVDFTASWTKIMATDQQVYDDHIREEWDNFYAWAEAKFAIWDLDAVLGAAIAAKAGGYAAVLKNASATQVPTLGLIELWLRVMAYEWPAGLTRDQIKGRLQATQFRLYCKGIRDTTKKIAVSTPSSVFVCAGRIQPAGVPRGLMTIATTADHYNWCDDINNFFVRNHEDRFRNAGFNVSNRSNAAYSLYFAVKPDAGKGVENLVEKRKNEITAWKGVGAANVCNHVNEFGIAFSSPNFAFKPRCLRCQHLFEYTMGDKINGLEEVLLWPGGVEQPERERFSRGWLCAETHAHFYCRAADHHLA
ncbi:hypothetical protein B0T24DRAFT_704737 [Lasiosphaeria ovina]|uniref:Uncharacterized protein n=1 Tax=Lasiosphaeria ovina TaxID=92902 RepID=A0AAE0KE94_9PEZI|nr:hypothetical protein B0T24DRAFT_704737 [Lasiosphaeria ovina]